MNRKLRVVAPCISALVVAGIYLLQPNVAATESDHNAELGACLNVGPFLGSPNGRTAHSQVLIRGATFTMGHNSTYPEERPAREAEVEDFYIDAHEVTNAQFRAFVDATDYVTTAEQQPDPSLYPEIPVDKLVPGSASFIKLADRPKGQWRNWWKFIDRASWRQPNGAGSNIDGMDNYPVVHVSYRDAKAYAEWVGRELPTEAQWEFAAQASANLKSANTWQGHFPMQDKALDGFDGIAPVGCYNADDSGLFDMRGNVWELVADIYHEPAENHAASMRVIKGGSYLCADNFCQRDRPQARQGQEEDFSTNHVGFRTVIPVTSDVAAN